MCNTFREATALDTRNPEELTSDLVMTSIIAEYRRWKERSNRSREEALKIESCDTKLFDQITFLTKYVTVEKIQSWEENSVTADQRRVECFQYSEKKNIPYNHMLTIVA